MPKNILITGGTGFIGGHLSQHLVDSGYHVTILTRSDLSERANSDQIKFASSLDSLANIDWYGVINLAGEPLDKSRWSDEQKAQIIDSRVSMTLRLNTWIRDLPKPLEVYIFLAPRLAGTDTGKMSFWMKPVLTTQVFLNQLCEAWESAANELADLETRICTVRIGIVLGGRWRSATGYVAARQTGSRWPDGQRRSMVVLGSYCRCGTLF